MNFSSSPQQLGKNWLDLYGLSPLNRQRPLHPLHYHHRSAVQSPIPAKERGQKKTGLCGENSQSGGRGLTQTHFLKSIYQVIFGRQNDSEVLIKDILQ